MSTILWRCIALITSIGNILFNYTYQGTRELGRITDSYGVVFTPAGYAFAIWGLIYLSTIVYLAYSLTVKQREVMLHERLGQFLTVLSCLSICWLIAYTNLWIGLSTAIISVMLVAAGLAARVAARVDARVDATETSTAGVTAAGTNATGATLVKSTSRGILIPFALYAGWLSVATIANYSIWFKASGWSGGGLGEETWGVIMIVIAGVLGVFCSRYLRTMVYPLVIAWACIAIYVKQEGTFTDAAWAALIVAVVNIVAALLVLFYRKTK